jgi:hypothetical protein
MAAVMAGRWEFSIQTDTTQVLTMNGHPANAFQWFGRSTPEGVLGK